MTPLATRVILYYFQSWGQSESKRDEVLKELFYECGLKPGSPEAKTFLRELSKCWPLGKFEDEEEAVEQLIARTKEMP